MDETPQHTPDETQPGAPADELGEPDEEDTWRHPGTLAVTAFTLAVITVIGAPVLRGLAYTLPLARNLEGGLADAKAYIVAGAFLSTAFALVPLVLARMGLGRLLPSDPPWTGHLLRAGFLLAALSFVLHLVLAVLAAEAQGTAGLSLYA